VICGSPGELGAGIETFTTVAERGQGAGGTAELRHQHPRTQLAQPVGMAVEGGEPDRGLVAEGHRQRVLQMGAPRQWCVAMAPGEVGEMPANCRQIVFDQREPRADLQDDGGIHDVLGRGSPMDVAAVLARPFGELADERQDRVSDGLGFLLQAREIERPLSIGQRLRRPRDRFAYRGRDDPEPSLGAGKGRLDFGTACDEGIVPKDPAHRRGTEHVGENCRVEDADRHYRANTVQPPSPRRSSAGKRFL